MSSRLSENGDENVTVCAVVSDDDGLDIFPTIVDKAFDGGSDIAFVVNLLLDVFELHG